MGIEESGLEGRRGLGLGGRKEGGLLSIGWLVEMVDCILGHGSGR